MNISISKDTILQHTTTDNIFQHFLQLNTIPNANISSPFSGDKNPSFKIYKDTGTYKCFSTGKQGDTFQLVADLYNLDCKNQFSEVLNIIATELNLPVQCLETIKQFSLQRTNKNNQLPLPHTNNDKQISFQSTNNGEQLSLQQKTIEVLSNDNSEYNQLTENKPTVATEIPFKIGKVQIIDYEKRHIDFWNHYKVSRELLQRYKVNAISSFSYFSKNKNKPISYTFKDSEIAFCYEVNGNYEVYVPAQVTRKKFFCNGLVREDVFGWQQLNGNVGNIIVCAGKKDTLVAISRGFNAVTFRSETHIPAAKQIEMLQQRCNNLFVCYDNDKGGQNGVKRIVEQFPNVILLQLPDNYNDVADYFIENTNDDFQSIIDSTINAKSTKENQNQALSQYELPKEVTEPIENLISDIEKYAMFIANSQIWMRQGDVKKHCFKSVSNFSIEVLQHMQDEKTPLKLIRIKNIFNQEHIFDIASDRVNTPQKFDDTITAYGNYLWTGNAKEFQLLRGFLFDKMGNGKKIDCLGWQKEHGFWVWNNKVNLCEGNSMSIDENGIFNYNNISFYIPSANKIYKNNVFKYEPQKKFSCTISETTLENYLAKILTVHGNNSITAMLFTMASIFQDIVTTEIQSFPILFLQGQASSGKDQLAFCCQSFLGKPQTAINVEAGVSTAKAHIREFAQFSNGICQFSEYKNGDKQLDGILKGIWDRNGYKRGTIESSVATESVPILSSLILTSNYFPDDEPLITRLLWLDMNKNVFTTEEIKRYDELADITSKGISSFADKLLCFRKHYLENFKMQFRNQKELFSKLIPTAPSRISTNYAVLIATYQIFSSFIHFPFTYNEMLQHFKKSSELQLDKISAASKTNKWWDCFLVAIKTANENKLQIDKDIKVEGSKLYFNFSNVYSKIQRQWYMQYKESIPAKTIMQDTIKKDKSYIETKSSFRFGIGRDCTNTSAYVVDIDRIPVSDEIKDAIQFITHLA